MGTFVMTRFRLVAWLSICAELASVGCGGGNSSGPGAGNDSGGSEADGGASGDGGSASDAAQPDSPAVDSALDDGTFFDSPGSEGGAGDVLAPEGGPSDGAPHDASVPDGSGPDSSSRDAGGQDGSALDSGAQEGGAFDAADDAQDSGPFMMQAHPPWPKVPLMSQGTTLKPIQLVSIVVQGETLSSALFGFGDALVASTWWTTVGKDYSLGAAAMPTVHVTGPAIPQNTTRADPQNPGESDMVAYIQQLIASNTAPAPHANTLYMLYLPPGIVAYDEPSGTSNTDCQLYGGYHSAFDATANLFDGGVSGVSWAFAQRCGQGQVLSDQDTLTVAASHEIIESATDAVPGYGWGMVGPVVPTMPWTQSPYAALGGEVGDLCANTEWSDGTYAYQRVWSNTAAMGMGDPCVPAYPNVPYVNTSAPQGWYSVAAGSSVNVPLTGFSDRATADWYVYAAVGAGNDTASHLTGGITSSTTAQTTMGTTATTNNGRTATLTLNAAAGTPSGTWILVEVVSQPEVANGGDPSHFWPVGIYVP